MDFNLDLHYFYKHIADSDSSYQFAPMPFVPFFWPIVDAFIIIGTNKARDKLTIGPREVTRN